MPDERKSPLKMRTNPLRTILKTQPQVQLIFIPLLLALLKEVCFVKYFVRSGDVNIVNGRLGLAGINGYWWSRAAAVYTNTTRDTAYILYFNATDIGPSGSNPRWDGISLRCLAD